MKELLPAKNDQHKGLKEIHRALVKNKQQELPTSFYTDV